MRKKKIRNKELAQTLTRKRTFERPVAEFRGYFIVGDDQIDKAEKYFNRGRLLSMKGLYLEAIDAYKKALEIDPGHTQARTNLHFTCFFKGVGKTEDRIKNVAKTRNLRKDTRVRTSIVSG